MSMWMLGTYDHKLDGKGRIVLPAQIRGDLGSSVVATIGIGRWKYVSIYPIPQWERFQARLDEAETKGGANGAIARDARRFIMAYANALEIDSAGRILVPQKLREYASIEQEVKVIGGGNRAEIWNASLWNEFDATNSAKIAEMMEELEI